MSYRALLSGSIAAALAFVPLAASATPIWATWTLDSAATATANLPDGRSAIYTGFPYNVGPADPANTAVPLIPGVPNGTPPGTSFYTTAAVGMNSTPGNPIGSLDLGSWGIDAETTFSLEDILDTSTYRIELLDAALGPLSLAGVQLSQHNLFYSGGTIGDYDLSLDPATGNITVVQIHDSLDPNATSRHSGLAVFSNLPATTRYVRLSVAGTAITPRDGVRLRLSGSPVPEPSAALLLGIALLAGGSARVRSWANR